MAPLRLPSDADVAPWTKQPGGGFVHVSVRGPIEMTDEMAETMAVAEKNEISPYKLADVGSDGAIKLRDYQNDALAALDNAWQEGKKAPLIVLPCGAGKTIVAAQSMNRLFQTRGTRSLFLAHRKELLDQTAEKIRLVSPRMRVGIVQANRNEMGRDVTIASIQTLGHHTGRRLETVIENGPYGLVICDEAHRAVSPQWMHVLNTLKERYPEILLYGMTATPGRADGVALDRVFDDVCFYRSLQNMIDLGHLVPPKGYKVTLDIDLDTIETHKGDFVQKQLSQLMNTPSVVRAVVRAWCEFGHDRKTVVFAVDIAHAHALAQEFCDAGYKAEAVDSKTKKSERAAIFKRYRSGETKLLCQCEIAVEGYDDPSVEAILQARPTKSQTLYVQSVGRGLRPYPAKTECIVIDCVGNSERHSIMQLASLSGFDPERALHGAAGDGKEPEVGDETPEVIGAEISGEEFELTHRANQRSRYTWRQASLGWILQIPRIGYYLVAWHDRQHTKSIIRFYDQRPGRRDDPPRDVMKDPVSFEIAYQMVEAECDRIFNARMYRKTAEFQSEDTIDDLPPEINFVDIDEGLDEEIHIPEAFMLKDAKWRNNKASAKQLGLLKKLGVKEKTMPDKAGEASDLIAILQVERDAKMRLPPTQKQVAYLRLNGLGSAKTKGAAGRKIWQHRKATQ